MTRKPVRRNIHLGSGEEGRRRLLSLEQIAADLGVDAQHGPGISKMIQDIADGNFEVKMKTFFNSLGEALDYGYELPSSVSHKDKTTGGWGYDLVADDGRTAIPVNTGELTKMEKQSGKQGDGNLVRMMFPPK